MELPPHHSAVCGVVFITRTLCSWNAASALLTWIGEGYVSVCRFDAAIGGSGQVAFAATLVLGEITLRTGSRACKE
nr:hypothetical protein Itr_chr06CG16090 [Ipomoea trifida]